MTLSAPVGRVMRAMDVMRSHSGRDSPDGFIATMRGVCWKLRLAPRLWPPNTHWPTTSQKLVFFDGRGSQRS